MPGTILVADDEWMLRRTLERVLCRAGFSVLMAENGEEAVKLFNENRNLVDLCILDMNMPVLNGVRALEEIRRVNEDANIILSSGESEQAIWDKCRLDKPNGIIQKPFALERLLLDIQAFLS
jgi:two-component system cell cycle sensor histidine kinase/response regulator CckA